MKGKYSRLLLSLCLVGVLYPAMPAGGAGMAVWTAAFCTVLWTAQNAVAVHPGVYRVARALAVLTVVALAICLFWAVAGDARQPRWLLVLFGGASLAFVGTTTVVVLADVMRGGQIDVDEILGAVCVYVLLGVCFAYAYLLLHGITGLASVEPPPGAPFLADYLYFSFATLTTLGYGDVRPAWSGVRLLAPVEALSGQIYLTILVARLVGLHIAHHSRTPPTES